jgi:hypothetical protein
VITEPEEALLYGEKFSTVPWIQLVTAQAYRAGAAASEARIKVLEEALWGALPHLEKCFTHHAWHTERPFEPHYIVNIRALLKEGDQ